MLCSISPMVYGIVSSVVCQYTVLPSSNSLQEPCIVFLSVYYTSTVCGTVHCVVVSMLHVMIDLITSRCFTHGLFLSLTFPQLYISSVSTSLVGHVLYSVDLMSAICTLYSYPLVHRYIYSRYSPVFLILYQLYHSLPFSTLISSLSLYLSVAT